MAYTIITSEKTNTGTLYHFVGTSSDTKPAGTWVGENSEFKELDTGDTYFYDNPTTGWVKKVGESGGSGGGGSYTLPTASASTKGGVKIGSGLTMTGEVLSVTGGGGAGKFTVTFTDTESNGHITADKTLAEIVEAKEAGDIVVGVYTYFGVPCEVPCVTAFEMQMDDEAVPVAAFAGPVAGDGTKIAVITGIPDGGGEEWSIDLSELISTVSYNDLEDKPFYEEITAPAINYSIPYTDGSNPDKSYDMPFSGVTVNAYLYRVGDALTASQLEGATVGTVTGDQTGDETDTFTIASNNIHNVTNGRYFMTDGTPLVLVADTDDVDIDIQDLTNFKALDAGTYLVYVDAESIQSGAYFYSAYLSKAAVTTVHKLNSKFYDSYAPLIVTMTEDQNTPGTYVGDKTFGELKNACNSGRNVTIIIDPLGNSTSYVVQSCLYDSGTTKVTADVFAGDDNVTFEGFSGENVTKSFN